MSGKKQRKSESAIFDAKRADAKRSIGVKLKISDVTDLRERMSIMSNIWDI